MKKDFISIMDLSSAEIEDIFALTDQLKKNKAKFSKALYGKTLALIFQKPSNRTRVSFQVGMYQLGGNSLYLAPNEINLGVRESIEDVSKTLSRYVDAIVLRTFEHKNVVDMARFSSVPVVNGLSDSSHPCQALADIYTVREKFKNIEGRTLAYVGDGNNVCNSLMLAAVKSGMNVKIGTPKEYEPDKGVVAETKKIALAKKLRVELFNDASPAADKADVLYTDVWTSMGQEEETEKRRKIFKSFQLNKDLLKIANKGCIVMHCLPAHRGEEITGDVMDSPNSVVFDQAENRMHVQKAILIKLLKKAR